MSPVRVAALTVGIVGLVAYVLTLLPGVAFSDWGEMQTVPYVLGIAHPTGYPTYILVAWLFDQVPIGSVAFRGNLLSAICIALAMATAVLILGRLGVRPVVAAAAALAFGAATTVWDAATVAEVNPLHVLFATLLVHQALAWAEHHRVRDLAIGGLLLGLALGNHLLAVTIAPFVILFVLWSGRHAFLERPWMAGVPVVTTVLALAVYLYLPIRAAQDPPLAYNDPETLDSVLWLVRGTQFEEKFRFFSGEGPTRLFDAAGDVWSSLAHAATPVVPLLGLAGLVVLTWWRPAVGLMCLGILAGAIYFYATYEALEHYLLVPLLILGIGTGIAVEAAARSLVGSLPRFGTVASRAIGVAALAGAVALGAAHWGPSDRSRDRSGEAYVEAVLGSLPTGATILTGWTISTPLWHAQLVEGRRPDVTVIDDTNIVYDGWGTRERAIADHICARPVFILRIDERELQPTRSEYELETFVRVTVSAGGPSAQTSRPIYRVLPRPGTCPG
jgi:transmembrane protein TMEM260 (protein O-mannosyltransferase)